MKKKMPFFRDGPDEKSKDDSLLQGERANRLTFSPNKKNKGDFFKKQTLVSGALLLLIMALAFVNIGYFDILSLAPYQKVEMGQNAELPQVGKKSFLPPLVVETSHGSAGESYYAASLNQEKEDYSLKISLGGAVPVKTVDVDIVKPNHVIVGGQSIGILLHTNGVTVVGHSPVILSDGNAIYPAKDSGLETGDFIIKINDISVNNNQQVAEIIDKAGKMDMKLNVKYIRNGEAKTTEIKALYCEDTKSYRTGLYIRDNTAGVGTLTFYDPVSGKYGALGHMISDLQDKSTNKALGSIVRANIQGIKIGRKGVPGEKMGVFVGGSWQGSIEKNTNFGIFGSLDKEMKSDFYSQALPIALIDQVKEGPAKILTVINGEKIEEYDINIMKILPNHKASGKGMVIEVTDERLLSQTGGIVQGMSGSPIIQNGRLIGAVSHVFINDPMKGYGCFAFWMMEEMQ